MARLVAELEMCGKMSSSDARGVDPLVGKSQLVTVCPQLTGVASSDEIGKEWRDVIERQGQISKVVTVKIQKDTIRKFEKQTGSKRDRLVGFVPIQIANLSVEVELHRHMYVGVASPARCCEIEDPGDYGVCIVQKEEIRGDDSKQKFKEYLQEKLVHLWGKNDRY
jgi:hypothetical protein